MDPNICIFWDSITWWWFDNERWGWAERIKTELFWHWEDWIEVYNLWISWKDSSNLVERYANELKSRDANVAIIAIGINDSCYTWDESNNLVPLDVFLENLKKIKNISEKLWLKKLIFIWLTRVNESMVCPYPWSSTGKSYKNHIIEKYDNAKRGFCEIELIPYIDMRDIVSYQELPDWLHPGAVWNKKMAEKILPELKKILNL